MKGIGGRKSVEKNTDGKMVMRTPKVMNWEEKSTWISGVLWQGFGSGGFREAATGVVASMRRQ